MAYSIARKKKTEKTQIFMQSFENGERGKWKDWDCSDGVNLPLTFEHPLEAQFEIARQQAKDPEWDYEIREYLR